MNPRDEQIAAIKAHSERLRQPEGRLDECYGQIRQAYEASSIVDSVARVVEEPNREPSDFHVLTNSEARPIHQFMDTSFYWERYCTELGRSVANGERKYIIEELQKIAPEGQPISVIDPSFVLLATAASTLQSRGHNPDTLFAPIGLFVPFGGAKEVTIDWASSPRRVVLPGGLSLKFFWSYSAAPLDRFVVFDSTKVLWRVKLDPITKARLTVAIGEPRIATGEDAVVFLAETVAKFEIADPRAFYAISLDGEPLDPMEYVNRDIFKES